MNKLRGRIKEICGNEGNFATMMGMSRSAMSQKLNGKRGWTYKQIVTAQKILSIPAEEVDQYFGWLA